MQDLTKRYGPVRALHNVSLDFRRGEVHALIGENGAGKSTFMKILSGIEQPTAGRLLLEGRPVTLRHPLEAQRAGIAMIHQELNLIDELNVAENIFLGRERCAGPMLRRRAMRDEAGEHLRAIGAEIDPGAKVGALSIAQQQMVEIAKAVSQDARIIIMDEPSAVLTGREVALLLKLIARLRGEGRTVLYVSHILSEVLAIADRITVLRDGQWVTTLDNTDENRQGEASDSLSLRERAGVRGDETNARPSNEPSTTHPLTRPPARPPSPEGRGGGGPSRPLGAITEHQLANLMVGREITQQFPARDTPAGVVALRVEDVSVPGHVDEASFEVRAGEVFGFAGLIGAGRTELAEAVAGLRRRSGGVVECSGRIAYLSEDRRGRGLVMGMTITANTTLAALRKFGRFWLDRRAERDVTQRRANELNTKLGNVADKIETLSGGNQQKVAIAKWLETEPSVLILDEPTRGIDVGAKAEIYRLIHDLAAQGMACVVISSELNEVIGLCHRIAVMRAGRIVTMLDGQTASEESIMKHAAGVAAA